jgi:hypothetical protein
MKAIVITALAGGLAALGQDGPVVSQTPAEITVRTTVGAIAGARIQVLGVQPIGGEPAKDAPYSAEAVTETTQTLADGNRIVTNQSSMQYRDGMGRERREQTLMKAPADLGGSPEIVLISDPVANTTYSLNTRERTAQKMPDSRRTAVEKLQIRNSGTPGTFGVRGLMLSSRMILNGQPDAGTVKTEDLGSQLTEGILANGTRITRTIPAGQIGNQQPIQVVDESWFSPELQIMIMTRHNDPREGETVYKLTKISRAEPDPSLFQVPQGYVITELPPIPGLKE